MRDETVRLPARQNGRDIQLTATLYTPNGEGPFPLVVINHGKSPGKASEQPDSRFYPESLQFVRRGYAVLVPVRAGFGSSGGSYLSGCRQPLATLSDFWADDVKAAIDYARTLPYIDTRRIVVVGASQGGLVSTALGVRDVPGLLGIVNFAGGLRQENCRDWANRNTAAFRTYGANTNVPALFIYGDNDAYWGDGKLSRRFFNAYHAGNPRSTYVDTGVFAKDTSHHLFENFDGLDIWVPIVGRFFQRLGLTWDIVQPPHSDGAAALGDADAVPFQRSRNTIRSGYERFLLMDPKNGRAFALSENGAWSRQSGKNAAQKALDSCREHRGVDCRLYAVDGQVVYQNSP
ncbi:MAG TPA: CocE/NonD family hydrolase [Bordetella sp.]